MAYIQNFEGKGNNISTCVRMKYYTNVHILVVGWVLATTKLTRHFYTNSEKTFTERL
jgi:hypothetical protein